MKLKDGTDFSWHVLFAVTSICFFIFSGLTKLLDGSGVHCVIFFKIGAASFVLYGLTYANSLSVKAEEKKKRARSDLRKNKMLNY